MHRSRRENAPTLTKELMEDFVSDKNDPHDSKSQEFPWDEVIARLDGISPGLSETDYTQLATALRELLA